MNAFSAVALAAELALGAGLSVRAAEVLVSCEERNVERWRVDSRGAWARMGYFIEGGKSDVKPTGLAVRGNTVYVADSRGKILAYAADGKQTGVVARMDYRPDKLCVSPDGLNLLNLRF